MHILRSTGRLLSISLAVALPAALAQSAPAQSALAQSSGTLLVANQKDHTLSFIDAATAKETFALQEGRITGHEVATSPDGRTAYLPIYGDAGVGRPAPMATRCSSSTFPPARSPASSTSATASAPTSPSTTRHRNVLYVSTELDKAVTVIDPKTLKIVGTVPTGAPSPTCSRSPTTAASPTPPTSAPAPSPSSTWTPARPSPLSPSAKSRPTSSASPSPTTTSLSSPPTRPAPPRRHRHRDPQT